MNRLDLAAALAGTGCLAWITHRLAEERTRRRLAEVRMDALEYATLAAPGHVPAALPAPMPAASSALETATATATAPRNASMGSQRPGPIRRDPPIARTFDHLFTQHAQGIPIAFLRALAYHESRLNPRADNGHAVGLLQIEHVVRLDYNRRHGSAYTREDLFDPAINVRIGVDALRTIIASYRRRHAAFKNLQEDWNNYRFIELLAQGWNAGWSDRAGVGRVAQHLGAQGATLITAEQVQQNATAAGATRHLIEPRRLAWAKGVARHYAQERAREYSDAVATGPVADRIATSHASSAHAADEVIEMPPVIIERRGDEVIEMPPVIIQRPSGEVIEMPPMIIDRAAVASTGEGTDASPVSMPSQVDPSPSPAFAATPVPIDPYAEPAASSTPSAAPLS
jgi:hypothetical protein